MTTVWRGGLLMTVALGACFAPPPPATPPPAPTADVIERFRLQEGDDDEPLSVIAILGSPETPSASTKEAPASPQDPASPPRSLTIEDVVLSVEMNFPLILAALQEVEIAAGRVQAAQGSFDTKLASKNLFELDGFYQKEQLDFGLEQPTTLFGTTFSTGYRLGQGDFAVYEGKSKTNEGGEFRIGAVVPLLQGGRIDPQRVALWQARIDQQRALPVILQKRLAATRKAASSYWSWVSRGAKRGVALRLLNLAEARESQVQAAVEEGLLARINLKDNGRLIADRRTKLALADRNVQEAAILLSLFWRDEDGNPLVPPTESLPDQFPRPRDPEEVVVQGDIELALAHRPELQALELEKEQLELDRQLAMNQRLANLDVGVFGSQDVGNSVNRPDDKDPFELALQVRFQLPLQRRKARGKEQEIEAKIAKLTQEQRFAKDVVATEVRDVVSALRQSWVGVTQAKENSRLASELEEAERLQLQLGESDLFRVNVREQQTAMAAAALIDVLAVYFKALAEYRAALGLPYDEVIAGQALGGVPLP